MPANKEFALFVDVMGVQRQLLGPADSSDSERRFLRCQERLEDFRRDLGDTIGRDLPLLLARKESPPEPSFVAEFSDAAYIVSERFGTIAAAGVLLMRKALRHEYPLRGGIGVGSFSHETSGVRTGRDGQIWSTSSFLGGAVVRAYQAERSTALGLRVFIHPAVMQEPCEPFLDLCTVPLGEAEACESATYELRVWRASEAIAARDRLRAFERQEDLTNRARAHHQATAASYERLSAIETELPFALPAFWLFR